MTRKARADNLAVNALGQAEIAAGQVLRFAGQTGSTVQFNVANMGIGTKALPALAAGATGTVTIADTTIRSTSMMFFQVKRSGSSGATVPAAGTVGLIAVVAPTAPGFQTVTVDVVNQSGAAILATDYELWYWAVGPG